VSTVADWLIHLADPLGPGTARPRRPLAAAQAPALFDQAERHGVLAPVLLNFERERYDSQFDAVRADAVRRHHAAVGFSLLLQHQADALLRGIEAAGLAAIVVKGPVFARCLYPDRSLRRFTDIDILAAPDAVAGIADLLAQREFLMAERAPPRQPLEWKWLHRDHDNLTIEVQTDLIHAAALRPALSLTYADVAGGAAAGDTQGPAVLLLIAAIHGAGHHYERLLHLVDICQAARAMRTVADEQQLERLIGQTGSRFAVVTGLNIAACCFDEPRLTALAKALGPVRLAGLAGALIDRSVIASTMNRQRALHSWRRSAYRELLKRPAADRGYRRRVE
jgi:hypothetical protein